MMTRLFFSLLPVSLLLLSACYTLLLSADAFIASPHHHKRDVRILHRSPLLRAIKLVEKEATTTSSSSNSNNIIVDVVVTQPPTTTTTDRDPTRDDDTMTVSPTTNQSAGDDDAVALLVAQEETKNNNALDGLLWRAVVVVLCAVWASNFPAIKLIVAEPGVDSLLFAVARFTTAVVALAPFCIRQIGQMNPETIRGAAICGSWVAFGYLGQLIGLLTTTASRSCVICSLHCVFVAAIAEFSRSLVKQSFDWTRLAPAAVAVAGVALVELKGAGGAPSIGDLLSFAQPIGFGMGYLQLEELMRKDPDAALPVSAIKLFMVACASLFFFELQPLFNGGVPSLPDFGPILASPVALSGVLYTGLITTALALYAESVAFRRVPATDASIILTTEPLFAAALAAVFVGETFGTSDYVGAALIIGACVLAVLNGPGEKVDPVEDNSSP